MDNKQSLPMDNKSNLSQLIKASKNGYDVAFQQVLKESKLSLKEINELWSEYGYLIDDRTGSPYDYVPVWLPREKIIKNVINKGKGRSEVKLTTLREHECLRVEGCDTEFHRSDFYSNDRFQSELRKYYKSINKSISMVQTRKGWLIKIYMGQ